MRIANLVREISERYEATPAQVALAWLLQIGVHVVPAPGTKRRRYLEENLGADELVLSRKDLDRITGAVSVFVVAGERYGAAALAMVDR